MEGTDLTIYFDLVKISEKLLQAAESADLEILDKLMQTRNNMLKIVFADFEQAQASKPEKTKIMHRLLELNNKIVQCANQRRQYIINKIINIKNSKKVNQIYNQ